MRMQGEVRGPANSGRPGGPAHAGRPYPSFASLIPAVTANRIACSMVMSMGWIPVRAELTFLRRALAARRCPNAPLHDTTNPRHGVAEQASRMRLPGAAASSSLVPPKTCAAHERTRDPVRTTRAQLEAVSEAASPRDHRLRIWTRSPAALDRPRQPSRGLRSAELRAWAGQGHRGRAGGAGGRDRDWNRTTGAVRSAAHHGSTATWLNSAARREFPATPRRGPPAHVYCGSVGSLAPNAAMGLRPTGALRPSASESASAR